MPVVEIHIKHDKIQKIDGHDVHVFVHDHDIKKTIPMTFKSKGELYDDIKNTGYPLNENILIEEE
jgi:hypothetical protein